MGPEKKPSRKKVLLFLSAGIGRKIRLFFVLCMKLDRILPGSMSDRLGDKRSHDLIDWLYLEDHRRLPVALYTRHNIVLLHGLNVQYKDRRDRTRKRAILGSTVCRLSLIHI